MSQVLPIILYFGAIMALGAYSFRRVRTSADFVLGNRSLNYILTAMAAHASDMSSWLFMGYPAIIFMSGMFQSWLAVGLLLFMWLNWTYVAPKLRTMTGQLECSTLPLFYEKLLHDHSGGIRIVSGILYFIFYSVYLCAGLVGLGVLGENMFGLDYTLGITLATAFILLYVFLGGYIALAWLDLLQGTFLLAVVLFVPIYVANIMGIHETIQTLTTSDRSLFTLVPSYSIESILLIISMILGWGLGYFGQPHILTKFMGIRHVDQMNKSRNIGMSWMTLALLGATAVGLVGIAYFPEGLKNSETIFIYMVKQTLHPFMASLILCAIIAATINVMSSQLLVLSSTLAEDLLGPSFLKHFPGKSKLWLMRFCVLLGSLAAYLIAYQKLSSVFSLVKFAWAGLGASFGPLTLLLLYGRKITKQGALAGLVTGGAVTVVWPFFESVAFIDSMVPGYFCSVIAILIVSKLTKKEAVIQPQ